MMKYASLDTMIKIVATAFEGKHDEGGVPYIMHCLAVMDGVKHLGYKAMMIAVGHDLIEDTSVNADMLRSLRFHPDVVAGIVEMTHKKGEKYEAYIVRIAYSELKQYTIPIKQADLMHNSQLYRLKGVTDKDLERAKKYARAYTYLKEIK